MTEGKFRSETGQTRRNFEERMAQRVERRGAREREKGRREREDGKVSGDGCNRWRKR